jgi:hypothetical protein
VRTVVLLLAAVCCVTDRRVPGRGAPPAGEAQGKAGGGIAADYPGDAGIGTDPRVIFSDDFEGDASSEDLDRRWNARYHNVSITRRSANVYAGAQSIEMLAPQQTVELSNGIAKVPTHELDTLFLRYYSKFDDTFDLSKTSQAHVSFCALCQPMCFLRAASYSCCMPGRAFCRRTSVTESGGGAV